MNSAESDPLLSPPPYRDLRNPNVPESSYIEPPAYADVSFSPFDGDTVSDVNSVDSPSRNSEKTKRYRGGFGSIWDFLGFFFFFNSSGQIEKPDPFKTRLKPVSVFKTRSETLLRKRGGFFGTGRVGYPRVAGLLPSLEERA